MDPKIEATYAQIEILNELDLKSFWGLKKNQPLRSKFGHVTYRLSSPRHTGNCEIWAHFINPSFSNHPCLDQEILGVLRSETCKWVSRRRWRGGNYLWLFCRTLGQSVEWKVGPWVPYSHALTFWFHVGHNSVCAGGPSSCVNENPKDGPWPPSPFPMD